MEEMVGFWEFCGSVKSVYCYSSSYVPLFLFIILLHLPRHILSPLTVMSTSDMNGGLLSRDRSLMISQTARLCSSDRGDIYRGNIRIHAR